jgi:hypothetical protein
VVISLGFEIIYIGLQFFAKGFSDLPDYCVWAIRLGIILFVIFSLEGFVMGSRLMLHSSSSSAVNLQ